MYLFKLLKYFVDVNKINLIKYPFEVRQIKMSAERQKSKLCDSIKFCLSSFVHSKHP